MLHRRPGALGCALMLCVAHAPLARAQQIDLKQIKGLNSSIPAALGVAPTGSGGVVLQTSPILTTPNLGKPSAIDLTNASNMPVSATLMKAVSPTDPPFNAKCDGITDDSAALQSWLNVMGTYSTAYAADYSGVIPAATCAFTTSLSISGRNAITIMGLGQNSLLKYTGASTTVTPFTFGSTTGGCSITSLTLKDFYLASATHMTAGAAIELDDACAVRMQNLGMQDNAGGGYGNWYVGLIVKGGNQVYLADNIISGSLSPIIAYGDDPPHGSTQLTDLRIRGGLLIGGSSAGVNLAGNVGGAAIDGVDILQNGTQLRISQDLVAIPNIQVFIGPTAFLDATTGGAGIDIDVEDAGGNNSILTISGASIASAGAQCVVFGNNAHWELNWNGGLLANCAATGMYISNTAVVKGQVAGLTVNPNAAGFAPSSGYGFDCGSSGSPGLTFTDIKFLGTWPSGYFNNCAVQGYTLANSAIKRSNTPVGNETGPFVAWQWDVSAQASTAIASGANAALPVGSGMIITNDIASGDVSAWICGGGTCVLLSSTKGIGTSPTTTPAAGKYSIQYDGATNYRVYNNIGSTLNVQISLNRTRAAN